MSSTERRNNEQQHVFTRQATILRKNLFEWDHMLRSPQGESWPTMVGRLNAALNQCGNLDRSIDDVLEHFVYLPKQSPVNPQDIPFFLSTRLEDNTAIANEDENTHKKKKQKHTKGDNEKNNQEEEEELQLGDALKVLSKYENRAAQVAAEYEEIMVRF
mmetsp:Transcript_25581/g.37786  ORF Transcript_25581/g.37786 Transcript_25581/m.37786 type:complete len:159 (-) Transcript_25581:200-676(-)